MVCKLGSGDWGVVYEAEDTEAFEVAH